MAEAEADMVFAEIQLIIDTGDEEAMRDFRDALDDALDEIDNALYKLTVKDDPEIVTYDNLEMEI